VDKDIPVDEETYDNVEDDDGACVEDEGYGCVEGRQSWKGYAVDIVAVLGFSSAVENNGDHAVDSGQNYDEEQS
jgi:hypothetical protein